MKPAENEKGYFRRFQTFAINRIASHSAVEKDSLLYWRARILFAILFTGLLLSLFVFIPIISLVIKERLWGLAIMDGAAWVILLGLVLCRLRYEIRAAVTLLLAYAVGVAVILSVGPLSGGPAWLFAFAVLTGVLLGSKNAIAALVINAMTLTIIGWLMSTGRIGHTFPFFSTPEAMIVAGANFMFLNAVTAISVTVLVKGLVSIHQKERALTGILEKERSHLIEAKKKLELEIEERNRTERALQRLQEQLQRSQKMEALGLMAGGIAHDLNNILSGIVSYPELLLMDLPEDSPLRKPIKTIQESGMRAADVVEDLLTVARGVATAKEVSNLNTLIEEYLNSAEHQKLAATHPSVTFKTGIDSDLLNMSCSTIHIKKTLMNLVTNASEAIGGDGTVTISTLNRYLDEPLNGYDDVRTGEYAMLTVSDDGSGISLQDLERIFEPFYTKKVMGRSGTGLGLAVVWNTVRDHDGYINVNSGEKGTVFELYFPVTREEMAAGKEEVSLENYLGHGEEILVVDDEERQREIACGMLAKLGYNPKAVPSGEEAIEYVKDHPVDLIVLDMVMPKGINGRETYEEIIKIRPNQKTIIASGYAKTKEMDLAQKLGAGKYIKKPYILEKIGLSVKEELEK